MPDVCSSTIDQAQALPESTVPAVAKRHILTEKQERSLRTNYNKSSYTIKHGLTAGRLPRGASYVTKMTNCLRKSLDRAVMERYGDLDVWHNSVIVSAIRWERHSLLCQRWLREDCDNLTPMEKLAYSREVARASSSRDKCLLLLGLNRREVDEITLLYADEPEKRDESMADESCEVPRYPLD